MKKNLKNIPLGKKSGSSLRKKLYKGLIPAVPVPFAEGREIHMRALDNYILHMKEQDICGVAVNVHTGRGLNITQQERIEVIKKWRQGLGKNRVIIAGANYAQMAIEARENGADAVLVYPPVTYKNLPEMIINYHEEIASLNIPMILFYLYEAAGGVSYSLEVLKRLFTIRQVVGIKVATLDSVMTFQNIAQLIKEDFPEIMLITGEDRMLGYTLMCGAESALVGMGACCTKLQLELIDSYFSKKNNFFSLSDKVDQFAMATFTQPMEGYIQRMLYAMYLEGVIPQDAVHDPFGPSLAREQFDHVRRVMKQIGVI